MKNLFLIASILMMSMLVCCSSSEEGNVPDFDDGQPVPESENLVLAYVIAQGQDFPDPKVVTHINYAFGEVNKTFDGIIVNNSNRLRQITALKKENPDLKICLSIGGFGSSGFSEMAGDANNRKAFAKDCKRIIDDFKIDGIDIDWEYPTKNSGGISASPDDIKNYTLMMRDIRSVIGKDHLLTFASSASAECFDFRAVNDYIDFVNIMAYDMDVPPHHHSALYRSELTGDFWGNEAVTLHKNAGLPLNKMLLGVPFYGHGAKSVSGFIDYKDIINLKGYTECWDDIAKVPYLKDKDGDFVCTYENAKSLSIKCEYVKERNLKGIMYWYYGADDKEGTLRNAVYKGMRSK